MNDDVKEIALSWEKLRVAYNLILLVEGSLILREGIVDAFTRFRMITLLFIIVANLCFGLGPLLEIYFHTFAKRRIGRARYLLFSGGLLFSMWWAGMWALRGLGKL